MSAEPGNGHTGDQAVREIFLLVGLAVGLPAGEALYRADPVTPRMVAFSLVAAVCTVIGVAWPQIKRVLYNREWPSAVSRFAASYRLFIISAILIFIVFFEGPEIYSRQNTPAGWGTYGLIIFGGAVLVTIGMAIGRGSRLRISITPPTDGILRDGQLRKYGGRDFVVRGRITGDLPDGHTIWIVNENPSTNKIWPQRPRVTVQGGEWEGGTYVSKGDTNVTIVALVVPPGVDALFEYYFQAMPLTKQDKSDGSQEKVVLPINCIPGDCKVVARIKARRLEND